MSAVRSAPAKRSHHASFRVFRPSGCFWAVAIVTVVVFAAMTFLSFRIDVPVWQRLVIYVLALMSPLTIVEVARRRVEISETELKIVNLFSSVSLPRADIRAVTWAKGLGVMIQLADGQWLKLPPVGGSSLGVTNTIRAWLKHCS
jgi:hypothetical protein